MHEYNHYATRNTTQHHNEYLELSGIKVIDLMHNYTVIQ